MRLRDGTRFSRAAFGLLAGVYALGLAITVVDKIERVGRPDIGWMMDGAYAAPTRRDAALAGLWGGGRVVEANGARVAGRSIRRDVMPSFRRDPGATNTLTLRRYGVGLVPVSVTVRPWEWRDVFFAEGLNLSLGALFFLVGAASFLLRPFSAGSWALLSLCSVAGGLETALFLEETGPLAALKGLYVRSLIGVLSFVPLHAALAFPVVHPLLLRRPRVLALVYGLAAVHAAIQVGAWAADWSGPLAYVGPLDMTILLVTLVLFLGRCLVLALRATDALTAQRARILLAGAVVSVLPFTVANFLRTALDVAVDMRVAQWLLSLFVLTLGWVTVRYDFVNARAAARRALVYAASVGVFTVLALLLVSWWPPSIALLLLPLLSLWPRFDRRLDAWLYPTRERLPDILREIGDEMATAASVEVVLDSLARAPGRACGAETAVAFLFAGVAGPAETVCASDGRRLEGAGRLADEALVHLLATTRKEVFRDHVALEPQYSRIAASCYACFDRLGAEALLPIPRQDAVIGGLALGAKASGDAYDAADLAALSTLVQQAVQSLGRIEATERLSQREIEFADLKRFFPPEIIDQVVARGGAAELRSQRKLVTVLFADLRGFTSFSDSVEPEEVTATLDEYYGAMGRRIAEHGGTLERFAGDGFLVFFNDPVDQPDHVERAVRMALSMHRDLGPLRASWARKGYAIDTGVGIHTGYATCGFIGYEGRRDYGVIGNVPNLAARLSDLAGPGEILVSARVRAELGEQVATELVGERSLKGFHQPQAVYRLLPP